MKQAIAKIEAKFQSADLKYTIREEDDATVMILGISGIRMNYQVILIAKSEDNDVAIRVFDLVKYPTEKRPEMLDVVNGCNTKFRYAKFVLNDRDNTVQVEMDIPLSVGDVGETALELLVRLMKIIDDCSVELMRAVWA